ncbi:hypothetical protein BD311DRAFT_750282 [Dichomitus squalens]|nr:hypothetical protein BD311DRAFT_750282 [Dichomitus squalens]
MIARFPAIARVTFIRQLSSLRICYYIHRSCVSMCQERSGMHHDRTSKATTVGFQTHLAQ